MSNDIEIGLARLTEKVESINTKLDIQLAHIQSNVESKASKAEVGAINDRVKKIESSLSWAVMLTVGAVILAILGGGYLAKDRQHTQPPAISQTR